MALAVGGLVALVLVALAMVTLLGTAPEEDADGPGTAVATEPVRAVPPLDKVLPEQPPPGYIEAPPDIDEAVRNGPLDLEAAAGFAEDRSKGRELLRDQGFTTGYSRAWLEQGTGRFVGAVVFEFESRDGARRYTDLSHTSDLLVAGAKRFDAPGVPGAKGVAAALPEEDGTIHVKTVHWARDQRSFAVFIGAEAEPSEADALALAAEIYGRS